MLETTTNSLFLLQKTTTICTSGPYRIAMDMAFLSTNRSSSYEVTLVKPTPSDTIRVAIRWPLKVKKESSNWGLPSNSNKFVSSSNVLFMIQLIHSCSHR